MIKIVSGKRHIQEIASPKLAWKHKMHIKNAMYNHGKEVTFEIKKLLSVGTRTGRRYRYQGRTYTASAPGEPPAARSGNLVSKINYKARPFELVVKSDAEYSGYLEYGTKKMEPRPYFVKTNQASAYKLERDLRAFK